METRRGRLKELTGAGQGFPLVSTGDEAMPLPALTLAEMDTYLDEVFPKCIMAGARCFWRISATARAVCA